MIDKWKLALKEFLKEYEEDDDVIGALLCGSYASGNQNDNSDIDVHLILKDSVTYRKRGNTESNSYLIEYFMSPVWKLKEEIKEELVSGKLGTAIMFAYGKIIYDVEGKIKELQDFALEYIDKKLPTISQDKLDMNNYYIWDCMDELKVSLEEDRNDFELVYYNLLGEIYNIYAEYLSIPKLPLSKVYRVLIDEKYRKKCHAFKLPEKEFIKLYIKCYDNSSRNIMYNNMIKLVDYYYEKQGGFNIRTFELISEVKKW